MSASSESLSLSNDPSTEQVAEQDATKPGTGSAAGPAAKAEAPENASPPVATAADGPKAVERLTVPDIPGGFGADGKMPGSVCRDFTSLDGLLNFRSLRRLTVPQECNAAHRRVVDGNHQCQQITLWLSDTRRCTRYRPGSISWYARRSCEVFLITNLG